MQKVVFVENGDLIELNNLLKDGWNVVSVQTCSEVVSSWAYGYAGGETYNHHHSDGKNIGNVYAYFVIEKVAK